MSHAPFVFGSLGLTLFALALELWSLRRSARRLKALEAQG